MHTRLGRGLILLPLMLLQIGCDHVTKDLARTHLMGQASHSYLGGVFKLLYVENTGGFLGLGAGLGELIRFWVLTVGVAVVLVLGLVWLLGRRELHTVPALAAVMVLAGGAGNLLDRLTQDGRVSDFMLLGVGSLRTGVFNVADLQIMAGVALLARLSLRPPREPAVPTTAGSG